MNINFTTNTGVSSLISIKNTETIGQLLKKYLESEGRPDLFESKKLSFYSNSGGQIKLGNKTEVKEYFKNNNNPEINVIDEQHLIGPEKTEIYFITSNKKVFKVIINKNCTIKYVIKGFFKFIGKEKLKGNKKINFIYNDIKINSKHFDTKFDDFFEKNEVPKIIVDDPKNLI